MALTATIKKLLNNLTPGAKTAKLGDLLDAQTSATQAATATTAGIVKQATVIAPAAGANPTKAEYDALLAALKASGQMATS